MLQISELKSDHEEKTQRLAVAHQLKVKELQSQVKRLEEINDNQALKNERVLKSKVQELEYLKNSQKQMVETIQKEARLELERTINNYKKKLTTLEQSTKQQSQHMEQTLVQQSNEKLQNLTEEMNQKLEGQKKYYEGLMNQGTKKMSQEIDKKQSQLEHTEIRVFFRFLIHLYSVSKQKLSLRSSKNLDLKSKKPLRNCYRKRARSRSSSTS